MHHPLAVLVAAAVAFAPAAATAWTRPGHMVAAAIAYDELMHSDPRIVAEMLRLLAAHPDPGPFQVAIDRSEGEERNRRLFLEMARWADDVRGGPYDRPTWHYRFSPLAQPGASYVGVSPKGSGIEALALNVSVARDPGASDADRAVALCWILHLVADFHQPLHSAERFATEWPLGDRGGSKVFVLDTVTGRPVTLHWFWDAAVSRSGTEAAAFLRAREMEGRFPRTQFATQLAHAIAGPDASAGWLAESYDLAVKLTYRSDAPRATTAATASQAPPAYALAVANAAEQRLTLAGYRLTDLLREMFAKE